MPLEIARTDAEIRTAAAALRTDRPTYAGILAFYEAVFIAQAKSRDHLDLPPISLDPAEAERRIAERRPLIAMTDFVIDVAAARDLFLEIRECGRGVTAPLDEAARRLTEGLQSGELAPDTLFSAIIGEDDAYLDAIADQLAVERSVLAFIGYASLYPALASEAERLAAAHLADPAPLPLGQCPVCGNRPGLAALDDRGGRYLICGFCAHPWPARRIFCPFCEVTDSETLRYFFTEAEPEYRVDLCDACKTYLKTIDTRHLSRPFHPPLEKLVTLHLDVRAKDEGYASGTPA